MLGRAISYSTRYAWGWDNLTHKHCSLFGRFSHSSNLYIDLSSPKGGLASPPMRVTDLQTDAHWKARHGDGCLWWWHLQPHSHSPYVLDSIIGHKVYNVGCNFWTQLPVLHIFFLVLGYKLHWLLFYITADSYRISWRSSKTLDDVRHSSTYRYVKRSQRPCYRCENRSEFITLIQLLQRCRKFK